LTSKSSDDSAAVGPGGRPDRAGRCGRRAHPAGQRDDPAGRHLTVGGYGAGIIARIGPQGMDVATAQPGMRPFDMTGRPMRGIVVIDSTVLDGKALERWIEQARSYVAGLPPR